MIPLLSYPLAIWALLAIPALVAIYILQNRFRRHIVSSLMLWADPVRPRQGGLVIRRIRTPLLFILELIAILLLVAAAASPFIRAAAKVESYVFILDDSFSMQARDMQSARERALAAINKELAGRFYAKFILAGTSPRMLSQSCTSPAQVGSVLSEWKCFAPASALEEAIALGRQLDTTHARLIVVTDRAPDAATETQARIEWWAFGKPHPNAAIINASRTEGLKSQRCFFEIANYSSAQARIPFIVIDANGHELLNQMLTIEPNQPQQVFFELDSTSPITASIPTDSLDLDNKVTLLAPVRKKVRVNIALADESLKRIFIRAVESTSIASLTSAAPQLTIRDSAPPPSPGVEWQFCISSEPNASAYVGPFILDRSSRLCDDLVFDGVIWAAAPASALEGRPLISAGNIPLLTDSALPASGRLLRMKFSPRLSNLQNLTAFPVLVYNLLQWRRSELPGPAQVNCRLGTQAAVRLEDTGGTGILPVILTAPDSRTYEIPQFQGFARFDTDLPGIYKISAGTDSWQVAVNELCPAESDLASAASGTWGKPDPALMQSYAPLSWLLLLLALITLAAHSYFARRTSA